MKSKGMRLAVTFLALTIGGLATAAHAQRQNAQGPQTSVKFKFKDVVVPGSVSSDAYGINNKKVIVGDFLNSAGQQQGMYFKNPNRWWGPSCPGYRDTALYAVNAAGTAVGYCDNGGGRDGVRGDGPQDLCGGVPCPLLYDNNVLVPIPDPPCDCPYMALAINSIVTGPEVGGWYQDTQGLMHGFISNQQTGALQTLDVPGAFNSSVWGINNAGEATLQAADAAGQIHSYLFDGTSYRNIDVPGAVVSFVHGINNNGDIVYTVEDANGNSWGVFFYASLRQLYWFNQSDGRRTLAYGINDEVKAGTGVKLEIVGTYQIPGAMNRAYEATVNIKQ